MELVPFTGVGHTLGNTQQPPAPPAAAAEEPADMSDDTAVPPTFMTSVPAAQVSSPWVRPPIPAFYDRMIGDEDVEMQSMNIADGALECAIDCITAEDFTAICESLDRWMVLMCGWEADVSSGEVVMTENEEEDFMQKVAHFEVELTMLMTTPRSLVPSDPHLIIEDCAKTFRFIRERYLQAKIKSKTPDVMLPFVSMSTIRTSMPSMPVVTNGHFRLTSKTKKQRTSYADVRPVFNESPSPSRHLRSPERAIRDQSPTFQSPTLSWGRLTLPYSPGWDIE